MYLKDTSRNIDLLSFHLHYEDKQFAAMIASAHFAEGAVLQHMGAQVEPVESFQVILVDRGDLYNGEVLISGPPKPTTRAATSRHACSSYPLQSVQAGVHLHPPPRVHDPLRDQNCSRREEVHPERQE